MKPALNISTDIIFHITRRQDWEQALIKGVYRALSLATEGFIHCSTDEQVVGVANRFYRGQTDLVLLSIDVQRIQSPIKYEAPAEAPDSSERFPHIYGPLHTDAVVNITPLLPDEQGQFK